MQYIGATGDIYVVFQHFVSLMLRSTVANS